MKKLVILDFDWALGRHEIAPVKFLNLPDRPDVVHVRGPYASFDANEFKKIYGSDYIKIAVVECSFPDYGMVSQQNLDVFDLIVVKDAEIINVDEYFDLLSEKFSNNKIIVLSSCPLDSFSTLDTVLTVPWFFYKPRQSIIV